MGALNKGCTEKGGNILGVIHDMFVVEEEDASIQTMLVSKGDTLSERKQLLVGNCDAIIVMPGGVGTLDELWESVCNRSLSLGGMEKIPICVLNLDGYFDGSISQLQRAGAEGLLYHSLDEYMHVELTASAALNWCTQTLEATAVPRVDAALRKSERKKSISYPYKKESPYLLIGMLVGCTVTAIAFNMFSKRR